MTRNLPAPLPNPAKFQDESADGRYRYLKPFAPMEWQLEAIHDTSPILVLTGAGGGGKSLALANKSHLFPLWFPGANVVVMRKVAEDMPKSVMALLRNSVIGADPRVTYRLSDGFIQYKSRVKDGPDSFMWFVGLKGDKQRTGLRSIGSEGAIDFVWMEEGIEYEEEDFDEVLFRVRGTAAPWTQIAISTNPGPPAHWIYQRLMLGGEARVIESSYLNNPYNSAGYGALVAKSRGLRRSWLKDGKWVAGENMVVDGWLDKLGEKKEEDNVTLDAEFVPDGGPVIWLADDGYAGELNKHGFFTERSGPRVFLLCQKRPDGRLAIFAEDLRVKTLASKHISDLLALSYPRPSYVIHDGAAVQLGGELLSANLDARPVRCKIEEGIKELNEWVSADENGYRRLIVHPRCKHIRHEMVSYVYDKNGKPIDAFNHTVDSARYGVWHETFGAAAPSSIAVFGAEVDMNDIDRRMKEVMRKIEAEWQSPY